MASPQIDEKTFIEVWNKEGGDYNKVAKILNMKPNSAWVRGTRLLRKYGVPNPGMYKVFEMNFEKLESEK